jgi:flavin-dependent dehydrogenase
VSYSADVLIVGAGPAGASTALHLLRRNPGWAPRIVVFDKAVHPREKLCGGAITPMGVQILEGLGLGIGTPRVAVGEARLRYGSQLHALSSEALFAIARRDELDHWLLEQARAAGVRVCEGEAVVDVRRSGDWMEVRTARDLWRARVVVGADGAGSVVRRRLGWRDNVPLARLMEVLTPETDGHPAFRDAAALFDFSRTPAGLQGYYWEFPSLIDGRPVLNRGVFDSGVRCDRRRLSVRAELAAALRARGVDPDAQPLKGFPLRWFDTAAPLAQPGALLVGDAAGADPLFGEGIAFALAYGETAAEAIDAAFATGDFSFGDYGRRVLRQRLLSHLPMRVRLAHAVYGIRSPRFASLCWRAAHFLVRYMAHRNPDYIPVPRPRLRRLAGET